MLLVAVSRLSALLVVSDGTCSFPVLTWLYCFHCFLALIAFIATTVVPFTYKSSLNTAAMATKSIKEAPRERLSAGMCDKACQGGV